MREFLERAWRGSKPLTIVAGLMVLDIVISAAGLMVDDRLITGAPAWLKPLKFGISSTIYNITLAWILSYISRAPRLMRGAAWATAAAFLVEIPIIDLQAARGTTSHFNYSTPLNSALFVAMGLGILVLLIAGVTITVTSCRQPFENRALGWGIRLGLAISMIGAGSGNRMVTPNHDQLAQAKATHKMPYIGAHTVGAPDGGPGLPLTKWSTEHGDLRVAHFVGLHAMQVLPLLAWFLTRTRRNMRQNVALVICAGCSYLFLWTILEVQAIRGQSVLAPDNITNAALLTWLAATVLSMGAILFARWERPLSLQAHA